MSYDPLWRLAKNMKGWRKPKSAVKIAVNGEWHEWTHAAMTYEQAIHLAYPKTFAEPQFTVVYEWMDPTTLNARCGTLRPGEAVRVDAGMTFDAVFTGRA